MMAVYALPASRSIATLCRARMPTLGCAAAEPASIVLLVAAKRPCSGWRCHARQLRYVGATDQNGPGLMARQGPFLLTSSPILPVMRADEPVCSLGGYRRTGKVDNGRFESDPSFRGESGNVRNRRISSVAECPDQGPLNEPAADARSRGWELLFLCRFLGRLDDAAIHARRRQASEKRQGTKSRLVGRGGAAGSMGIWPQQASLGWCIGEQIVGSDGQQGVWRTAGRAGRASRCCLAVAVSQG